MAVDDTHGLSDFVAGLDAVAEAADAAEASAAAAEALAATKSQVVSTESDSNPYSLATQDGQTVVVIVKGNAYIEKPGANLALQYDGGTVDSLIDAGYDNDNLTMPFTLTWVAAPGPATANLEVLATSGTVVFSEILYTIIWIT